MKQVLITINRPEEEEMDHLLDILSDNMRYINEIDEFHVRKYRIGMETIYTINYKDT